MLIQISILKLTSTLKRGLRDPLLATSLQLTPLLPLLSWSEAEAGFRESSEDARDEGSIGLPPMPETRDDAG